MSTITQAEWLQERVEDEILIISVLASRMDPKVHKKADYVRSLEEAIDSGYRRIVLDLTQLRYTNHVWGLFQLVFIANCRLNEVGGRLAVCGLNGHPRRAYLFAELDRYSPDYRSVAAALTGLKASAG